MRSHLGVDSDGLEPKGSLEDGMGHAIATLDLSHFTSPLVTHRS